MSLVPVKLGADRRKVQILAVLVVLAVVLYFWNRNSGDSGGPTRPAGNAGSGAGPKGAIRPASRSGARGADFGGGRNPKEFRPSMKPPKDVDPSAVDPTLHLAALRRLQDVKLEASTRSLFEISAAPPAEVKITAEPDKIPVK